MSDVQLIPWEDIHAFDGRACRRGACDNGHEARCATFRFTLCPGPGSSRKDMDVYPSYANRLGVS